MDSSFLVGIGELRREQAAPKPVSIAAGVDWRLDLSRVLVEPPLKAELVISPVNGGLLVEGDVTATVRHACYRCLDEWDDRMSVHLTQLVVDGEDEDADYQVTGPDLDLEPILRDEVLLSIPLRPTCGPDCTGVVDGSETGLNTGTPDDEHDATSPFAVLRDLIDSGD